MCHNMAHAGMLALIVAVLAVSVQLSAAAKGSRSCQFAVLVPRRMRTETATHVVLTSYRGKCTLDVILRPLGDPKTELTRKVASLRRNGIRTMRLNLRDYDVRKLQRSSNPRQVELVVQASGDPHPVIRTLDLDIHPGYLMAQTDKPVYSPGQTVHYRAIALSEQERWARWEVQINITSPDGLPAPVERERMRAQRAFQWSSLPLPPNARLGVWTVAAAFLSPGAQTRHSVTFEVKNYALPVFSVEVVTSPRLILDSTSSVNVTVKANYAFGKPVKGSVKILPQRWCEGDVEDLEEMHQALMRDGVAETSYHVDSESFPEGCHFQATAEVTEISTNQKQRAQSRSSIFASTPYVITAGGNRHYFRSGLPYHLKLKVKDVLGAPLVSEVLRGKLHSSRDHYDLGETLTDSRGHATFSVDGVLTSKLVNFTISVESDVRGLRPEQQARLDWSGATRLDTRRLPFLQMASPSPVRVGEPVSLTLTYVPGRRRIIIIGVWARGRCVFKQKIKASPTGEQTFQIPSKHTSKMYPSALVVAYYFHHSKNWAGVVDTRVVSDSLSLDMGSGCRHEIAITPLEGGVKPRSTHTLTLKGSPRATFAVWAVDNNVYLVNPSRAVTREKVFAAFSEYSERSCDTGMGMSGSYQETCFHILTNLGPAHPYMSDYSAGLAGDSAAWSEGWGDEGADWRADPVYRYFPESWLFHTGTLSQEGRAELNVTFPDSMTTWSITAMAVAPKGGLCVAPPLLVSASQTFNASLEAPPTLKRLESGRLVLRVVNSDRREMRGNIRLSSGNALCWESPEDGKFNDVRFRPRDVTVLTVDVFPIAVGKAKVRVAVDITSVGFRPEKRIHTLQKEIHIVGEGEVRRKWFRTLIYPDMPLRRNQNSTTRRSSEEELKSGNRRRRSSQMFSPGGERCEIQNDGVIKNEVACEGGGQTISMDVAPPVGAIPDSVQVKASVSGLLHASASPAQVQGAGPAEAALTDVTMTLHALHALSDSHAHHSAREDATNHLTEGITSLLSFRLKNGTFSLTEGGSPSTWLTALVVGTLCQSRDYVQVEPEVWRPGLEWVQDRTQNLLFIPRDELRPNALSESEQYLKLTTDVLLAAHYCGEQMEACDFKTMVSYLSGRATSSLAPAALSHVAFALAELTSSETPLLSGAPAQTRQRLHHFTRVFAHKSRDILMETALTTASGALHWSSGPEVADSPAPGSFPDATSAAVDIEATAYALLALLRHHDTSDLDLINVFRWLVEQRQPDGVFIGSVDTAVASQALAEFHKRQAGDVTDLSVNMAAGAGAMDVSSAALDPLRWMYPAEASEDSAEEDFPLPDPEDLLTLSGTPVGVELSEPTDRATIDLMQVPASGSLHFDASGPGMALLTVELTYSEDVELSPPDPPPEGTTSFVSPGNRDRYLHRAPDFIDPQTVETRVVSSRPATLGVSDTIHENRGGEWTTSTDAWGLPLLKSSPGPPDVHVQSASIQPGRPLQGRWSSSTADPGAAGWASSTARTQAEESRPGQIGSDDGAPRPQQAGLSRAASPENLVAARPENPVQGGVSPGSSTLHSGTDTPSREVPRPALQGGFTSPSWPSPSATGDVVLVPLEEDVPQSSTRLGVLTDPSRLSTASTRSPGQSGRPSTADPRVEPGPAVWEPQHASAASARPQQGPLLPREPVDAGTKILNSVTSQGNCTSTSTSTSTSSTPAATSTASADVEEDESTKTPILILGETPQDRELRLSQAQSQHVSPQSSTDFAVLAGGSHGTTQAVGLETRGGHTAEQRAHRPEEEEGSEARAGTAMPGRRQGVADGVCPYQVNVAANPAAIAGGKKTLCAQCNLGCEEEGESDADRNNASSHGTPVCSQSARSQHSTLMCVEVCVSEPAGGAIPRFRAVVHLQRGFCLFDATDLHKLESRPHVQEVKVINGTSISVTSSQALCVRFRQVTWQTPPHEPGLVVVSDLTEPGQVRCVRSFHGGHDMDRHLPAFCHDVTSSHIRECHCLQKTCPPRIPNTIMSFQRAIDRSRYVHYAELKHMRRGAVTAHLHFSLRETYKGPSVRALNSSQGGTELQFVVSLKCVQDFLPAGGRPPSPGQSFWLLGSLVHRMQDRFVYTVNEEVVAVPDRGPGEEEARKEDCRRRRYLRTALRNRGLLPLHQRRLERC